MEITVWSLAKSNKIWHQCNFEKISYIKWSHGSSSSTVTRLWATQLRFNSQQEQGSVLFSTSPHPDHLRDPSSLLSNGNRGIFPWR